MKHPRDRGIIAVPQLISNLVFPLLSFDCNPCWASVTTSRLRDDVQSLVMLMRSLLCSNGCACGVRGGGWGCGVGAAIHGLEPDGRIVRRAVTLSKSPLS